MRGWLSDILSRKKREGQGAEELHVIPVMVTGVFESGKKEFIRVISDSKPVSIHQSKPYVSLNFGTLHFRDDNISLWFFGWPCAKRIPDESFLTNELAKQRTSTVIVVDSVFSENPHPGKAPSNDQQAGNIINTVHQLGKIFLVVANKQDKEGARSIEEMRAVLQLDDDIPLLPCSAVTDPASVRHALIELLKLVPQDEVVRQAIANLQKLQDTND